MSKWSLDSDLLSSESFAKLVGVEVKSENKKSINEKYIFFCNEQIKKLRMKKIEIYSNLWILENLEKSFLRGLILTKNWKL